MSLDGARVFVVEDEALIMQLLEDMLGDLGAVVAARAANEASAVALANAADFEVAILDVNLNGERCFGAAEALRERGVPFIFATGYGEDADPRCSGAPIVEKPFRIDELETALKSALGKTSAKIAS